MIYCTLSKLLIPVPGVNCTPVGSGATFGAFRVMVCMVGFPFSMTEILIFTDLFSFKMFGCFLRNSAISLDWSVSIVFGLEVPEALGVGVEIFAAAADSAAVVAREVVSLSNLTFPDVDVLSCKNLGGRPLRGFLRPRSTWSCSNSRASSSATLLNSSRASPSSSSRTDVEVVACTEIIHPFKC